MQCDLIVVGLILYGHKVMKTIGDDICEFTFSRGFVSQLSCAISVLTATIVLNCCQI